MVLWTCGKDIESFRRAEGGKRGLRFISFLDWRKMCQAQKRRTEQSETVTVLPCLLSSSLTLVFSFLHQPSNRWEAEGY